MVGGEVREVAPELPLVGGPYVPTKPAQAAVKAVRLGQVLALGAYALGDALFASSPALLKLLARCREHRLPAGAALYLTHLGCEMAYSSGAFEVVYNGQVLFSKLREGRYPEPGEVRLRLEQALASERHRRAADSQSLVAVAAAPGEAQAAATGA